MNKESAATAQCRVEGQKFKRTSFGEDPGGGRQYRLSRDHGIPAGSKSTIGCAVGVPMTAFSFPLWLRALLLRMASEDFPPGIPTSPRPQTLNGALHLPTSKHWLPVLLPLLASTRKTNSVCHNRQFQEELGLNDESGTSCQLCEQPHSPAWAGEACRRNWHTQAHPGGSGSVKRGHAVISSQRPAEEEI